MKTQLEKARRSAQKRTYFTNRETEQGKILSHKAYTMKVNAIQNHLLCWTVQHWRKIIFFTQLYGSDNEGKRGKLQEANGGTLLIYHLNLLDVSLQAKLLHAVDSKVLNGEQLDIRYITTVNEDVEKLLAEKSYARTYFIA